MANQGNKKKTSIIGDLLPFMGVTGFSIPNVMEMMKNLFSRRNNTKQNNIQSINLPIPESTEKVGLTAKNLDFYINKLSDHTNMKKYDTSKSFIEFIKKEEKKGQTFSINQKKLKDVSYRNKLNDVLLFLVDIDSDKKGIKTLLQLGADPSKAIYSCVGRASGDGGDSDALRGLNILLPLAQDAKALNEGESTIVIDFSNKELKDLCGSGVDNRKKFSLALLRTLKYFNVCFVNLQKLIKKDIDFGLIEEAAKINGQTLQQNSKDENEVTFLAVKKDLDIEASTSEEKGDSSPSSSFSNLGSIVESHDKTTPPQLNRTNSKLSSCSIDKLNIQWNNNKRQEQKGSSGPKNQRGA